MSDNTGEDERLRILNEMRAYGKAAPFAHTAQAPAHENIYDASAREWLHSKTFRTMLLITCGVPVVLVCLVMAFSTTAVLLGGYAVIADVQQIFAILGLGG